MKSNRDREHYVKQEYLKEFHSYDSLEKVCCYNVQNGKALANQNTLNHAHENGFLEFDIIKYLDCLEQEPNSFITTEDIKRIRTLFKQKPFVDKYLSNPQFSDEFLSTYMESEFNDVKKISRYFIENSSLDDFDNHLNLTEENKQRISHYIAYQYLRTKAFREYLQQNALRSPDSKQVFKTYSKEIKKMIIKVLHIKMLFTESLIDEMTNLIYQGIWFVGIAEQPLFITSDNPVAILQDPDKMENFLPSVQTISYPLNSNMILVIHHPSDSDFLAYNRMYVRLNSQAIEYYNKQQHLFCNHWIYGSDLDQLVCIGRKYDTLKKAESLKDIHRVLLRL